MANLPQNQTRSHTLLLTIILIGTALTATYYYLYITYPSLFSKNLTKIYNSITPNQTSSLNSPLPSPTRSPSPLLPDSGTAGTFRVNHQSPDGPTLTQVIIDPLDPNLGDLVTVKLTLSHPQSIDSVKAILETDDQPQPLSFDRDSRTLDTETWISTFTLKSNVKYHYLFRFEAKSGTQKTIAPMALRNQSQ